MIFIASLVLLLIMIFYNVKKNDQIKKYIYSENDFHRFFGPAPDS